MRTKKIELLPLLISLGIPLAIGFIGSLFTMESVKGWYTTLEKPALNPPNSIFGPVWTALYIMMGIAAFRVWRKRKTVSNYTYLATLYFSQLILNLGWSFIFFNQHLLGLAVIEILVLLTVIVLNAWAFFKIDKVSGYLFIPYVLWVSFASYLTISIYSLN